MHTSAKGDLGVVKVISRLTELGWTIGILLSEHKRYDLFAEKEGYTFRVQVKYASLVKQKEIRIDLRGIWANSKGCHVRPYAPGDFDLLAVYCPDLDKCFFVSSSELSGIKTGITLATEDSAWTKRLAKNFETPKLPNVEEAETTDCNPVLSEFESHLVVQN
jgi:PD-(D/E)XK endonuclease